MGREIHEQKDYSEKWAEKIDEEVAAYIKAAEQSARDIIRSHKSALEKIVGVLLAKETIEKEEFDEVMREFDRT